MNDKIGTIKDYYLGKSASMLSIIYKGEVLSGDETFFKKNIRYGENFILMCGKLETKIWKRFSQISYDDYFYMSNSYPDAVVFKPFKDIYFLGFGLLNHYEKSDFIIKF